MCLYVCITFLAVIAGLVVPLDKIITPCYIEYRLSYYCAGHDVAGPATTANDHIVR